MVFSITFTAAPCLRCWFISLQGLMVAWMGCKQYLQEHLIVETWEPKSKKKKAINDVIVSMQR